MQPVIPCDLGMEGHRDDRALPDRHRVTVDGGQHLNRRVEHRVDAWCSNERRLHRSARDAAHGEAHVERCGLRPVRVALRADREAAWSRESLVIARQLVRQQDQSGARAEHGQAVRDPCRERSGQARALEGTGDRGRLPARQHETMDRGELVRGPHGDGPETHGHKSTSVLEHVTLQCEHTDRKGVRCDGVSEVGAFRPTAPVEALPREARHQPRPA